MVFRFGCLFGAALLLTGASAFAQSHDIANPTPLGPGVNKGNIDNFGGPHYFYFFAGPGHVDMEMAFKDAGIFGNPLRQVLNFDLVHEDGKVTSHNAVEAFDKLERLHTSGDLPERSRFILRVSAEDRAVKMGGYYEVTLTGAVEFPGKTVGAGVAEQMSDPLVHPMTGNLVTPSGPLVKPAGH
jgi:hypothetical protein